MILSPADTSGGGVCRLFQPLHPGFQSRLKLDQIIATADSKGAAVPRLTVEPLAAAAK